MTSYRSKWGKGRSEIRSSDLKLASLSIMHLSKNLSSESHDYYVKNENYNKSTLEHLLTFNFLSNPKATFGYF